MINRSDSWLIGISVDNKLYILNGRTLDDLTGQYTCHTPRGSSSVYYFIARRSLSQTGYAYNDGKIYENQI